MNLMTKNNKLIIATMIIIIIKTARHKNTKPLTLDTSSGRMKTMSMEKYQATKTDTVTTR